MRVAIRVASLLAVGSTFTLAYTGVREAVAGGGTVTFAAPADLPIDESVDKAVFVARPGGWGDAQDCAWDPGLRPSQSMVVVDPGGGGATRLSGVVVIDVDGGAVLDGLPNGTRLANIRDREACEVGGIAYYRYTADIE